MFFFLHSFAIEMASTSNAIIQCTSSSSFEYDVFVSFRGEDTRNSFTGFLFEALKKQGIEAFKDDKDIRKGESIAPELIRAIEGSHVFVVVFPRTMLPQLGACVN